MSHWAPYGFSQRALHVFFALFALLSLALAGTLIRAGSAPVSSDGSALPVPALAPSTQVHPQRRSGALRRRTASFRSRSFKTGVRPTGACATTRRRRPRLLLTPDKAILTFTEKEKGSRSTSNAAGASPRTKLVASQRAPSKVDYLVAPEHHRDLPTYREFVPRRLAGTTRLPGPGRNAQDELHAQARADLSKIISPTAEPTASRSARAGTSDPDTLGTLRDASPAAISPSAGSASPSTAATT